ncbi:hypothetical protein LZ31DRAFT_381797 [Colletotrichum somersetense]|nr:hypothetical protein LZ31DRAFT_381797 [Colletotrichum somersetense]
MYILLTYLGTSLVCPGSAEYCITYISKSNPSFPDARDLRHLFFSLWVRPATHPTHSHHHGNHPLRPRIGPVSPHGANFGNLQIDWPCQAILITPCHLCLADMAPCPILPSATCLSLSLAP